MSDGPGPPRLLLSRGSRGVIYALIFPGFYRYAWPTDIKELCNVLKSRPTLRWRFHCGGCCFFIALRGRCDVPKRAAFCCRGVQLIVQLEELGPYRFEPPRRQERQGSKYKKNWPAFLLGVLFCVLGVLAANGVDNQARPATSPVCVFTRTSSPSLINSGTRTVRPVSNVACLLRRRQPCRRAGLAQWRRLRVRRIAEVAVKLARRCTSKPATTHPL